MTIDTRYPMSPAEFDEACRKFELAHSGFLYQSSGLRSIKSNTEAKGHPQSKHLYGMARDYHWHRVTGAQPQVPILEVIQRGFWAKPYYWGFHIQGLPPGPIAHWWYDKYGRDINPVLGLIVAEEQNQ